MVHPVRIKLASNSQLVSHPSLGRGGWVSKSFPKPQSNVCLILGKFGRNTGRLCCAKIPSVEYLPDIAKCIRK